MTHRMTHLLKPDALLMKEYIDQFPDKYDYIDYDIRVGNGRDPGPDFQPSIRTMAIHLSQRRIDAVGHRPNQIDIIEVTLLAGIKAYGQLTVYPRMYKNTFPTDTRIQTVLVTREFMPDMEDLFRSAGITCYIYPAEIQ